MRRPEVYTWSHRAAQMPLPFMCLRHGCQFSSHGPLEMIAHSVICTPAEVHHAWRTLPPLLGYAPAPVEIPREMLATGDFVTPKLNGVNYFEKPPLLYWAVAGCFRIFGYNEWAVRMMPALAAAGLGHVRMLLQVHDELVFELPEGDVAAASEVIRSVMAGAAEPSVALSVPLGVEIGTGPSWGAAH